jgi:DMSO/TMAO reductase YedYZ molybdopterin-dependent catalytic subunit
LSGLFSRGFQAKRRPADPSRLPPGQYETHDFPVLSAGPTPRVSLAHWDFRVTGAGAGERQWTWEQFQALPREHIVRDIHCVTKWSKFDTAWEGVSVDTLFEGIEAEAKYVMAFCDGGYTTNMPIKDVTDGKAWIMDTYDGAPLPPEHGGPARLLVPHLYFWKSAKWVRGLRLIPEDQPGFWEALGYHNHGDPWREQRYWND